MREIFRTIVSALIWSKDGKLLMGRKDPLQGGVFFDCWHIPGGGINDGEAFDTALKREVLEETGLDISQYKIRPLPFVGHGEAEKILKETGEKVLCKMEFNRFEIVLDKNSDDIGLNPTDDLIEMRWFSKEELSTIKQIPGGKEFFIQAGYIKEN